MRRSFNESIWRNDDGQVIAVNLGSDFCAEHEFGIKGIKSSFGMNPDAIGISRHMITRNQRVVNNLDTKGLLIQKYDWRDKKKAKVFGIAHDRHFHTGYTADSDWWGRFSKDSLSKDGNCPLWGEDDFCFMSEDRQLISDLVDAFSRLDISIWLGGRSTPFSNGGLILAITSRLPKETIDDLHEFDMDQIALKKAAADTGIEQILKEAGLKWYALSPSWDDATKSSVIFWLNPRDQQIHNSGWMTVEDLKDWAEGKGKVMKTQKG